MSSTSSDTTIDQLATESDMAFLVSTAVHQKAKEQEIVNRIMENYASKFDKRTQLPPQTYAQVAQPRAHRSSSIKTVTNWPEVPEADRFVDSPYTHPYDRGMSDFPTLAPAVEKPFTNAPRQESPFSAHLPQVVDAKSFQEEVRRYPDLVFETVVQIIDELEAARAENEALKQENEGLNEDISGLKENWMDVRDQTLGHHKQLISTQVALAKTHKALEDAQKGLRDAKEEHNQRRLDWNSRAQAYEELWAIDKAKQVILWKFIERLQKGSLSEGESDSMAALPPWTGTTKNPTRMFVTPDSVKPQVSSSTGTEYSRSPEKTFNPTACAFVPGASPTKSAISMMSSPELPPVDILSCILSLPPRFFGICPNSLCASTDGYKCGVPSCHLQHVCEAYNDEKGNGCNNRECKFVHEYRSCHEEIDGWGCRFNVVNLESCLRKAHMKKKVHRYYTTREEWGSRVIIAGLRIAHQEGKY